MDILVVFPDPADDPWERILSDPAPRPALVQGIAEVREEVAAGKLTTMDRSVEN
ncbi:MAG: hypothetical protein ACKV0T_23215 [Planctomycetales bacterium]